MMRRFTPFLTLAALAVATVPASAQEMRFARDLRPGDRLELRNINGSVSVTQAAGRTTEVVVTKRVKRGDPAMVTAVLEEERGVMRVCTIYRNRDPQRTSCEGNNSISKDRGDDFEIEMRYEVRLAEGVALDGRTVNGSLAVSGVDTPVRLKSVNGSITFDGVGAHEIETVNGSIRASFSRADWSGTTHLKTVNGAITLEMPKAADLTIEGRTMNGGFSTDFPVTMSGRWGPRTFRGTIGNGGRTLSVETINGGVTLRER